MKRRRFIQTMAAAPALAVPAAAQHLRKHNNPRGKRLIFRAGNIRGRCGCRLHAALFYGVAIFRAAQAQRHSDACTSNNPGALEAEAPEFLDFLIGQSPAERQQIYRTGLDILNAQAMKQFKKNFAEVDETQANTLLAPLRAAWTYNPPTEPLARFLREAKRTCAPRQ